MHAGWWTSPSNAPGIGTATVVVRRSNRTASWLVRPAAATQGFIGISLTNSSPLVAPTRSRQPLLGTNPIAVAAPAGRFGTFCLDMATSTVPRGRIEVAARRGWTLLVGWAIDADGNAATTADAALAGSLHPLGGEEATGGYKGYGLAMVVELLTGIWVVPRSVPTCPCSPPTRDPRTSARRSWSSTPRPSMTRRGLRIAARDTAGTAGGGTRDPEAPGPVLVHGAPEAEAERRADERGIAVDGEHFRSLVSLGERLGVRSLTRRAMPETSA